MNKKKLCILVEDNNEKEDDYQNFEIHKESKKSKIVESPMRKEYLNQSADEEKKILDLQNPLINQIFNYMEGINSQNDISHNWYLSIL